MPQTSGDPVPSIAERDATGDIKALYNDIKAVTGVPVVNLVFRHIATFPGCLAWSWSVLRPIYANGEVAALAEQLMRELALPDLPALPPAALRVVGVDAEGERTITRIIEAYNRSNPMNMIALSTLLAFLDRPPQAESSAAARATAPEPRQSPDALPPLLSLADMDADTRTLVQALNSLSPQGEARTLASMYRQLAHWPGYLALALTLLQPLHARGELQALITQSHAHALALVQELDGKLGASPMPPPTGQARQDLQTALTYFTTQLIVEMLPVGKLLRATLPPANTVST